MYTNLKTIVAPSTNKISVFDGWFIPQNLKRIVIDGLGMLDSSPYRKSIRPGYDMLFSASFKKVTHNLKKLSDLE